MSTDSDVQFLRDLSRYSDRCTAVRYREIADRLEGLIARGPSITDGPSMTDRQVLERAAVLCTWYGNDNSARTCRAMIDDCR